ncbi:hypothetical protein WR25_14806 [Diploscapter pachys]|uniref:Cytochrome b561 domain-containing protein n=1 Tax=Diploscapter pachys TaxID=2018661 RepID=A0A2A2JGD1_9BILA|nr:hypothetical protein WR25_14806 [Diploscapter pachys]
MRDNWNLALLLAAALVPLISGQFDASGCGQSKGCLYYPTGCTPSQNCQIQFSFLQEGDYLNMEISSPPQGDDGVNRYAAIGFSEDTSMGDDTVVACASDGNQAMVLLSKNTGKSNTLIDSNGIIETSMATNNNGNLYCRFRQKLRSGNGDVKNLDNVYNILAARGAYQPGDLQYHGQNKGALPRTDLRSYKVENGAPGFAGSDASSDQPRSNADKLRIAHGILMVFAWCVFLATGILFARHFRDHWPDTKFIGVKMWFNFHRTLNMIGIVATICGFACIFAANDWEWSGPKPTQSGELNREWGSVHSMLGLLACVVAWAQPLNAVFRCNPDQKGRWIFNWIHRFFGAGAWLMAASAIMIAVVHFKGMFSNRDAALGLFIAYIAVVGIVLILMELLTWRKWFANRRRVVGEMEMIRVGPDGSRTTQSAIVNNSSNNLLLLIMLAFVVIAIGLSIAISVLIGLKPKS